MEGMGVRAQRSFPLFYSLLLDSVSLTSRKSCGKAWGGGADVADRAFGDTDVGEKGPQAGCVPWFDKAWWRLIWEGSWDLPKWRFLRGLLVAMVMREQGCVHVSPWVTISSLLRSHYSLSNGWRVREGTHHHWSSVLWKLRSFFLFLGQRE